MRGPATGPDTAVPGCDEADDLGLAALPQWPLSGAIRDKTRPARMLACPNRDKTRPVPTLACSNRYKTHPVPTLACSNRYKTRPAPTPVHPNRYKTHPAHTPVHPNRYKTRHTPQKSPISRHFRHAGRKLSRFLRRHSQQGDFFLAVGWSNRSWATCVAPPAAVSLTERFIFIATTCLGHGKLALALTRRSCPPCRMAIGML